MKSYGIYCYNLQQSVLFYVKICLRFYSHSKNNYLTATPDIRELGKNAELQSIISRYICENNAASAEGEWQHI